MKMFITGGTGFFGRSLLDGMLAMSERDRPHATILSRDPHAFLSRYPQYDGLPIRWIEGDIRSFEAPREKFDVVFHMATDVVGLSEQNQPELFDAIVEGTRRVLDISVRCQAGRVLITSSGSVYGPQPHDMERMEEVYSDSVPFNDGPLNYAAGKRMAERLAAEYHRNFGLHVCIARCFALVGPHLPLDAHFAMGNFIGQALRNEDIMVHGDGTPLRTYMHTDDLVRWLWRIGLKGAPMRPYNVGSDRPISIADLAKKIASHAKAPVKVHLLGKPEAGAVLRRYVPSIDRARTELGLDLQVNLDEAIQKTMAWHRLQEEEGRPRG